MHRTTMPRWPNGRSLVLLTLTLLLVACGGAGGGGAAANTPQAGQSVAQAAVCVVPKVVGFDQTNAERMVQGVGLVSVRSAEFSASVPQNQVIAQTPDGGTRLDPCKGEVSIVVSLGAAATTATVATPVSAATVIATEVTQAFQPVTMSVDDMNATSMAMSATATTATSAATAHVTAGAEGLIVFSVDQNKDKQNEIYTIKPDGTAMTRLTDNGIAPSWSPDGSRIAFLSQRDGSPFPNVYVMNADGSNQTLLSIASAEDPLVWSPDGTRIAFTCDQDICMVHADGSNQAQLAKDAGYPIWSPDGTRIAFMANRRDGLNIYMMDADGSNQTQLTKSSASGTWSAVPAWAPDGSRIAFTSDRDGKYKLYVMSADGSQQTDLGVICGAFSACTATWSPDSSQIAFMTVDPLDRQAPPKVYRVNADGSNLMSLADVHANSRPSFPVWSPDGKRIAFQNLNTVYVINADGSNLVRLVDLAQTNLPQFVNFTVPDWKINRIAP